MDRIYPNTIGLRIEADCGMAITGATDTTIEVTKPDGNIVSWLASIINENYLEHCTEAGDLDQPGDYACQAKITLGGYTGRGETFTVTVTPEYL